MDMEPYTAPGYTFITYSENGGKLNDVYVYLTNKGLKNSDVILEETKK